MRASVLECTDFSLYILSDPVSTALLFGAAWRMRAIEKRRARRKNSIHRLSNHVD